MADPRLLNYIKASLARKIPIAQIKNSLFAKGWQNSDINEAINLVTQKKPSPVQRPRRQIPVQRRPVQRKTVQPIQPSQPISRQRPISSQGGYPATTMGKHKEAKPKINLIFVFAGIFAVLLIGLIVFLIIRNASIISDEELSQGISLDLKENKAVKFKIDDEQHSMTVDSVSGDSVSVTVQSDPVSLTLKIGENKKIDFEQDGVYDLYIKLNDIVEGKADFLLKKIAEECVEDWNCTEWSECEDEEQTRECTDLNECGTENDKPDEIQECEIILSCSEQNGTICSGTETCNGTTINSSEGDCCLGECEEIEIELETIVCENDDIDCLINASETCHPAKVKYNITIDMSILGWIQDHSYYYEIKGLEDNKCEFYKELLSVNGSYTEDGRQLLKDDQDLNDSEIDDLEQEQNDALAETIGSSGTCKFPISVLEDYLTDVKDGTFSSFSEDDIDDYQCTGENGFW